MNKDLLTFLPGKFENTAFTTKSKQLDRNGMFYHITQQSYNRYSLFSISVAKYRDHLFKKLCEENHVLIICNIIMPTHTHDVVFAEHFEDIQRVIRILNINVSKFVKKERLNKGRQTKEPTFDSFPAYTCIHSKEHLFNLFKYLYDNPQYLRDNNEFVPYSCFDEWKKGYYKPYSEKFYIQMFGKSLNEITKLCVESNKSEYNKIAHTLFGDSLPI